MDNLELRTRSGSIPPGSFRAGPTLTEWVHPQAEQVEAELEHPSG